MVGDGPLRAEAQALLTRPASADLAWLPGERTTCRMSCAGWICFVLPSLAEGISNTILEAWRRAAGDCHRRRRQCGTGGARPHRADRAACAMWRRWPTAWCRWPTIRPRRGGAGPVGAGGAAVQPADDGGAYRGLYDRMLAGQGLSLDSSLQACQATYRPRPRAAEARVHTAVPPARRLYPC